MKRRFEAKLVARGPGGAWTFLEIPFDVQKVFGSKARVPVAGTINGFAFRNSLMPEGDGTHSMMVNKELQAGAKAKAGDLVRVTMQRDNEERTVEAPPELKEKLRANKKATSMFDSLTYSQKREYADWIVSAKQAATKTSRAEKAVKMLAAGQKHIR
jgi:hypothetical protein